MIPGCYTPINSQEPFHQPLDLSPIFKCCTTLSHPVWSNHVDQSVGKTTGRQFPRSRTHPSMRVWLPDGQLLAPQSALWNHSVNHWVSHESSTSVRYHTFQQGRHWAVSQISQLIRRYSRPANYATATCTRITSLEPFLQPLGHLPIFNTCTSNHLRAVHSSFTHRNECVNGQLLDHQSTLGNHSFNHWIAHQPSIPVRESSDPVYQDDHHPSIVTLVG